MSVAEPTIQIVDDDESFLAAISQLLRASGFAVRTFSSAGDLLAAADADAPGCVLADLQMPGMNGLTANPLARSSREMAVRNDLSSSTI